MALFTIASFLFFTALVGVGTWVLTRHDRTDTSEGYFLAGRSLTAGYIAGSLLLTNLSTEQLIGLNGDAFADGLSVMAWEVIAALSLVVMGLIFLPRYLQAGVATVPEYLERRFSAQTRTLSTLIFVLAYTGILLPMILYTGATGMNGILNVSGTLGLNDQATLWLLVWFIGIVGSIYAIFGGLRSVAVSDTLNGFLLLSGGLLVTWLGLAAVNADGPWAALQELRQAHPEKFNSLGRPDQSVPFSTLFTGVLLLNLFYWCTNQQIIQRAFAAKSLAEGQKGVLLAGMFKTLGPLILILPGIIAFHLYHEKELPRVEAYGMLVRNVLPPALAGFFAAVVAGAILSSYNSVLNSTATMFSLGIYQGIFNPGASDAQVIRVGKWFGTLVAIGSMLVAPLLAGQESIFSYLQKMNGLYFIPIFAVSLAAMFTRRVPSAAANAALVVGVTVIAAGYFVPAFVEQVSKIGDFHFLGAVFIGLLALMTVWTAISPRAALPDDEGPPRIDMRPWRFAWPAGALLTICIFAFYVAFADLSALKPKTNAEPTRIGSDPAEAPADQEPK